MEQVQDRLPIGTPESTRGIQPGQLRRVHYLRDGTHVSHALTGRRSGLTHVRFSIVERTKRGITGPVVYYLERADGMIKIGTTSNYPARRRDLIGQHGPLVLLAWEAGTYKQEHQRHEEFWWYRQGSTEWFAPWPDLLDHVVDLRWELRERGLA